MLEAVGHHPKIREGHQDNVCCSQVLCFSPAQSPAIIAASIGAGTVSQSLAEQAALFSWSILPSAAVCSSHFLTLNAVKGVSGGLFAGGCPSLLH